MLEGSSGWRISQQGCSTSGLKSQGGIIHRMQGIVEEKDSVHSRFRSGMHLCREWMRIGWGCLAWGETKSSCLMFYACAATHLAEDGVWLGV